MVMVFEAHKFAYCTQKSAAAKSESGFQTNTQNVESIFVHFFYSTMYKCLRRLTIFTHQCPFILYSLSLPPDLYKFCRNTRGKKTCRNPDYLAHIIQRYTKRQIRS